MTTTGESGVGYPSVATTPAGWYPDPTGAADARWWDGAAWTEHVSARPRPAPASAPLSAPISAQLPESVPWSPAAVPPAIPSAIPWSPASAAASVRPSGNTVGVWLLACVPTMMVVSMVVGELLVFQVAPQTIPYVFVLPVLVLEVVFAILDRRALQARGIAPASAWWILLLPPLIYLIKRGRAVRAAGGVAWPPELTFFLQWALGFVVNGITTALALSGR